MLFSTQNQRNYLIEDLITWKDYAIQIAAFNQIGIGVYSGSITVKTREGSKAFTFHFLFLIISDNQSQIMLHQAMKEQ